MIDLSEHDCPICKGAGFTVQRVVNADQLVYSYYETCAHCEGDGVINSNPWESVQCASPKS